MVDITYRTLGPWGGGKGANLQPSEVDENFYSLAQAIVDIQANPEAPNGIESIKVSGPQMTIYLMDGTVLGPYTLPVLTFRWRGEFEPNVYAVLDVFTVSAGNADILDPALVSYGIYMVQIAGTYSLFDQNEMVDGAPVYKQLFGSSDNSLSTSGDVDIIEPLTDGDVLRWTESISRWVNSPLGSMAVQAASNVNITGGVFHNLANPLLPGDAVNKAYVDAMPGGTTVNDRTMMSNISGLIGPALPNTLSDFLDYALLTTDRGTLLYRGGTGWIALPPGTSGYFLKTLGAGADPTWSVGGSGVTSVAAGAGITTGAGPITATGSVALAAVADNSFLANITGGSAAPSPATLTAFLDHVASSTRGAILTRAGSGWVALAPGVSGYYLQTQGATADAVWSSPSGSGTVTSISAGTGISTGGAPITGAGTVSLAAIGTASVLANTSGSTAAPVPATVSAVFDSVFGSTQGAVVYRNATTWVMLPPGTSGQVFTTGGASANPAWANAASGAPIANLLLLANISGSTAAPSGNSLSNVFDAILGSSRGMLVYRGASGWVALSAGTTGDVLTTGGTAGDPHWAATATGAIISVGDTAPASPSSGDAWWDSLGGQLYIRYDDGTSAQWVPASNQPGPQGPAGAAGANANLSGMVAGQLPVAATATSVTSSIALPLAVANGGTGSTTAAAALTSLGAASAASVSTADNLRVLKAGDTMTGDLSLAPLAANAGIVLNKPSGVFHNILYGQQSGVTRWTESLGDDTAETGSNSGSNYKLIAWGDTGTYLSAPLTITRATGNATFSGNLKANGGVSEIGVAGGDFQVALYSGNPTISFAANNYIQYVSGTGISIFTTGIINLAGTLNLASATNIVPVVDSANSCGTPTNSWFQVASHNFPNTSDPRLKSDMRPAAPGALGIVEAVGVHEFTYTSDATAKRHIGFDASQVRTRHPHAYVEGDDEAKTQAVNLPDMIAVLWQAVQELAAKVAALEAGK